MSVVVRTASSVSVSRMRRWVRLRFWMPRSERRKAGKTAARKMRRGCGRSAGGMAEARVVGFSLKATLVARPFVSAIEEGCMVQV